MTEQQDFLRKDTSQPEGDIAQETSASPRFSGLKGVIDKGLDAIGAEKVVDSDTENGVLRPAEAQDAQRLRAGEPTLSSEPINAPQAERNKTLGSIPDSAKGDSMFPPDEAPVVEAEPGPLEKQANPNTGPVDSAHIELNQPPNKPI